MDFIIGLMMAVLVWLMTRKVVSNKVQEEIAGDARCSLPLIKVFGPYTQCGGFGPRTRLRGSTLGGRHTGGMRA